MGEDGEFVEFHFDEFADVAADVHGGEEDGFFGGFGEVTDFFFDGVDEFFGGLGVEG